MPDRDGDSDKIALEHAWSWFALHATQRMQLVNYWLLAVAFLSTALVAAFVNEKYAVAGAISVMGMVSTISFHRLEGRTFVLVKAGESALRRFQRALAKSTGYEEMEILRLVANRPRILGSYKQVFLFLYLFSFILFLTAAVYSVIKAF